MKLLSNHFSTINRIITIKKRNIQYFNQNDQINSRSNAYQIRSQIIRNDRLFCIKVITKMKNVKETSNEKFSNVRMKINAKRIKFSTMTNKKNTTEIRKMHIATKNLESRFI